MYINLSDPVVVAAIIAALGAISAAIIKSYATMKSGADKQNVITLIEAQRGRKRTKIKHLKGTGSAFKMKTRIENENNFPMHVFSQQGTVFDTPNAKLQKMVSVRPQVFEVSPESSEEFTVDALCMDAFKDPPPSTGEGDYRAKGITQNERIIKLLHTLGNLEKEISAKIVSFKQGAGFTVKEMDADTEELLKHCELIPNMLGGYDAKIQDIIVQLALWQVTDKVNFDALAKLAGAVSNESRIELKRLVILANTILRKAGIKPTVSLR